jgi:hypothetical protein
MHAFKLNVSILSVIGAAIILDSGLAIDFGPREVLSVVSYTDILAR